MTVDSFNGSTFPVLGILSFYSHKWIQCSALGLPLEKALERSYTFEILANAFCGYTACLYLQPHALSGPGLSHLLLIDHLQLNKENGKLITSSHKFLYSTLYFKSVQPLCHAGILSQIKSAVKCTQWSMVVIILQFKNITNECTYNKLLYFLNLYSAAC